MKPKHRETTLKTQPTAATVIASLVLVTPLCGYLFACGCTWPWTGLFMHCGSLGGREGGLCPWCEHPLVGFLSVGLAIAAGYAAARRGSATIPSIGASVLGVSLFVLAALFAAIPLL